MEPNKSICADVREAGYKEKGVMVEMHRTGGKHYITLENCATGAFEVSQGYLSKDHARTVFSVLVVRLGAGYDYAALVELMNS